MSYLEPLDWVIIVLYLGGMLFIGFRLGRGQKTVRDYFLGNRNIPWWSVGLSIVATETSALTFIGVPALAFGGNLAFLQIIVGYVLARVVLAIFLVPHYFKGEIYSPYQLFSNAFGPSARRTAAFLFLIAGTLAAGVRVYVTCIPLQLMLNLEVSTAILFFVLLSLAYTYLGGIRAVIWTEVIQFLLFVGGGLFTVWFIPRFIDGGLGGAFSEAAAAGKTHWLNLGFSLSAPFNLWMGVFGATFQVMSSHGVDQLLVQRILTCRSVAEGRKALMLSAIIIFPLFLLFLATGVLLWVYYQHHPFGIPLPENPAGVSKNDYVYPIFILTVIPPVLRGFLIVAILAAAMSSVSAALSALSSVSTMDLFRKTNSGSASAGEPSATLRFGRLSTVGWAVVLALVAYLSREVSFVLNAALSLSGLTSGAMLGGLMLALAWRKGSPVPVVVGMLVSLVVMTSIHLLPRLGVTRDLWAEWVGIDVYWPWYTLLGTMITLAVAWITRSVATRFTPLPRLP